MFNLRDFTHNIEFRKGRKLGSKNKRRKSGLPLNYEQANKHIKIIGIGAGISRELRGLSSEALYWAKMLR